MTMLLVCFETMAPGSLVLTDATAAHAQTPKSSAHNELALVEFKAEKGEINECL